MKRSLKIKKKPRGLRKRWESQTETPRNGKLDRTRNRRGKAEAGRKWKKSYSKLRGTLGEQNEAN
jgi:hypothetical protein